MAVIKCKMCGGSLQISEDSSVCECEYCGTKQTVPKADDEKKLKLFDRAGRLLRGCEFDKAAGVFETIVADFPEEAEAYWGLVLCKYGIEYVDDPATGKKVPTCHRSSFDNVMKDPNFEQACENADAIARRVYRDEARAIEELRQAILQVSGREEPYDVFISYKEKDENGERTPDSVLAQDIYRELTREGYRVFFSRISLENRLGTEYEPYIFAALNSARVMIVVGTDYEHFDAVWVKNEWSRYLKLIAKGEKKTLIPVFRDMDAYDMPEAFNNITALDMGKLGALQDLVHGVEKILGKKQAEPGPAQQVIQQVIQGGGPNVTALLKRGRQALEDGAWEKADGFYEQVLSMDAENGEAFLGKFCAKEQAGSLETALNARLRRTEISEKRATLQIERQKDGESRVVSENLVPGYLKAESLTPLLPKNLDYASAASYWRSAKMNALVALRGDKLLARAEKFAQGELSKRIRDALGGYEQSLDRHVHEAEEQSAAAKAEREGFYAAGLRQAGEKAAALRREAEAKREQDYQDCCRALEQAQTREQYGDVEQKLGQPGLAGYRDCAALAERCRGAIQALLEEERQAALRKQEEERRAALQRQEEAYQAAAGLEKKARTEEEYRAAGDAFRALGDYKDAESHGKALQEQADALKAKAEAEAAERLREQQAREARALAAKKKKQRLIAILASAAVVLAVAAFLVVTKVILPGNAYKAAESLLEAGQYEEAAAAFEAMDGYKDSADRALEARYLRAEALEAQGDHEGAIAAFEALGNYKDSGTRVTEIHYRDAEALLEAGDYAAAAEAFDALGGWRDSGARAKEAKQGARYQEALACLQRGEYERAYQLFLELGNYQDAAEYADKFEFRLVEKKVDYEKGRTETTNYFYDENNRLIREEYNVVTSFGMELNDKGRTEKINTYNTDGILVESTSRKFYTLNSSKPTPTSSADVTEVNYCDTHTIYEYRPDGKLKTVKEITHYPSSSSDFTAYVTKTYDDRGFLVRFEQVDYPDGSDTPSYQYYYTYEYDEYGTEKGYTACFDQGAEHVARHRIEYSFGSSGEVTEMKRYFNDKYLDLWEKYEDGRLIKSTTYVSTGTIICTTTYTYECAYLG